MKNNVSPAFYKWSGMPDIVKEKVWDVVTVSACAFGPGSFHSYLYFLYWFISLYNLLCRINMKFRLNIKSGWIVKQ